MCWVKSDRIEDRQIGRVWMRVRVRVRVWVNWLIQTAKLEIQIKSVRLTFDGLTWTVVMVVVYRQISVPDRCRVPFAFFCRSLVRFAVWILVSEISFAPLTLITKKKKI